jgi:hypothetical protein
MAGVGCYNWSCGPFVILCVFCLECHTSLHVQVIPAELVPGNAPAIQIPN